MIDRRLRSNSGLSLVEVMVAAAVVTITFYGLVTIFTNYAKLIGKIGQGKSELLSVANFRESIMADPATFQMVANEYEGEARLQPDVLPWFVSNNLTVTRDQCMLNNTCDNYPNRMGYVIFPHESGVSRTLYTLKIRVYDSKNEVTKDFRYLVAPK